MNGDEARKVCQDVIGTYVWIKKIIVDDDELWWRWTEQDRSVWLTLNEYIKNIWEKRNKIQRI